MPRKASMLERRVAGETKSVPVFTEGNWFSFKLENITAVESLSYQPYAVASEFTSILYFLILL